MAVPPEGHVNLVIFISTAVHLTSVVLSAKSLALLSLSLV